MRGKWKTSVIFKGWENLKAESPWLQVVPMVSVGGSQPLSDDGARAFVTGRSIREGMLDGSHIVGIRCDHRDDRQVSSAFQQVSRDGGPIDILVHNVWGGYEEMIENGVFIWTKPFWEQPIWRWDAMFAAGVRAHYVACQLATPSMVARKRGLI